MSAGQGRYVVSDRGARDVKVFSATGEFVTSFGPHLSTPWGVCRNAGGQLMVSDSGHRTVFVHDSAGTLLFSVEIFRHTVSGTRYHLQVQLVNYALRKLTRVTAIAVNPTRRIQASIVGRNSKLNALALPPSRQVNITSNIVSGSDINVVNGSGFPNVGLSHWFYFLFLSLSAVQRYPFMIRKSEAHKFVGPKTVKQSSSSHVNSALVMNVVLLSLSLFFLT